MSKISVAPPTRKQLELFETNLERSIFIEHAAVLAGIPSRSLTKWLQLGRAGHKDFVEFVDIIDNVSARQADKLMNLIMTAVHDGDVKAAQWLYKQKFGALEAARTKKWIELEDALEDTANTAASEEDVAAAEARLLSEPH